MREMAIRGEERREGLDTLFLIFIFAPLSRRREAVAGWPLAQAPIRAVLPFYRERIREMAIRGERRGERRREEKVEEREKKERRDEGKGMEAWEKGLECWKEERIFSPGLSHRC
jgi:hypothetical protein